MSSVQCLIFLFFFSSWLFELGMRFCCAEIVTWGPGFRDRLKEQLVSAGVTVESLTNRHCRKSVATIACCCGHRCSSGQCSSPTWLGFSCGLFFFFAFLKPKSQKMRLHFLNPLSCIKLLKLP